MRYCSHLSLLINIEITALFQTSTVILIQISVQHKRTFVYIYEKMLERIKATDITLSVAFLYIKSMRIAQCFGDRATFLIILL